MTNNEYKRRSANLHGRLGIIRQQIENVLAGGMRPEAPVVRPLFENQDAICGEIAALDQEYLDAYGT